jgi:crotonobetainyl-CoA:carnitine CoA-transferase CaiB-like acyl-CoA transferase
VSVGPMGVSFILIKLIKIDDRIEPIAAYGQTGTSQTETSWSSAMIYLDTIWAALGGESCVLDSLVATGEGALPSIFPVTDLAASAMGAAGLAAAELIASVGGDHPSVRVDRRLASFWFGFSVRPQGWELPAAWDAAAGDYATADGWIRLHTNAPHHRKAALSVLGVPGEREQVAHAVARWKKAELESAVVGARGCAAAMHTLDEWTAHPQGQAVAAEPLVRIDGGTSGANPAWPVPRDRPLQGIRVLDLTRVLAGPVATRFLAGLGGDVLRIDPPGWEEPGLEPEVTLGKRTARLDLRTEAGRSVFARLLSEADVLMHGYRSNALSGLGFDAAARQSIRPGLVDMSLDAYGWTGPWAERRGFDSLVQMSSGIASEGMRVLGKDKPHPLPVQALDQACGYLMAAAVLVGLKRRLETGRGSVACTSLARVAALLVGHRQSPDTPLLAPETPADLSDAIEATVWGSARRIAAPVVVEGAPLAWVGRPPGPLGVSSPVWNDQV